MRVVLGPQGWQPVQEHRPKLTRCPATLCAGIRSYYKAKIDLEHNRIRERNQNIRRLEAQRNELNSQGKVGTPSVGVALDADNVVPCLQFEHCVRS